ncbi:Gibberellin-20 oxidase [Quillaja saponaria]|uniref:Gibberellin-20 oxidase n=1 Tax=Quillaja saponaria TaxID=32244 RepID=A0AAD7KT02_QUISA|nr:Gibberellin-20 oxidase [Quillaja saponaria]
MSLLMNHSNTLPICSPTPTNGKLQKDENGVLIFDSTKLQNEPDLPTEFIWPSEDLVGEELNEPLIDLSGVLKGDEEAIATAAELVRTAYSTESLHVVDYLKSVLGQEFTHTGWVYQRYCEAMGELSQVLLELLAISLGVDSSHYKEFFKDARSIMRCNYYPPCKSSGLTFGTGPHCDPTSLTILYQDDIGGLEVFTDNKWKAVRPQLDALVINIGDTFMALTDGKYKSCLHRALVNQDIERRSLAFFLCPKHDKVVRPPKDLFGIKEPRKYPDFTWSDFLGFTQNCYRI